MKYLPLLLLPTVALAEDRTAYVQDVGGGQVQVTSSDSKDTTTVFYGKNVIEKKPDRSKPNWGKRFSDLANSEDHEAPPPSQLDLPELPSLGENSLGME